MKNDLKFNLNENFKNPETLLWSASLILMFFHWSKLTVNETVNIFDALAGARGSSYSDSFSGFSLLTSSIFGFLVILIPIFYLANHFLKLNLIKNNKLYILFPVVSIFGMIVSYAKLKSKFTTDIAYDGNYGVLGLGSLGGGVNSNMKLTFGFWLELALFVAILVLSVINAFGLKGRLADQKEIKNMMNDVSGKMADGKNMLKDNIQKIKSSEKLKDLEIGAGFRKCPNCGNIIMQGKKFCKKCGFNLASSSAGENEKQQNDHKDPDNVQKNPIVAPERVCPNCGNMIKAGKRFCAKCGNTVEDVAPVSAKATETPVEQEQKMIPCEFCGGLIDPSRKFCPDCGKEIVIKMTPGICSNCGEPLIPGKAFCANCGTKA